MKTLKKSWNYFLKSILLQLLAGTVLHFVIGDSALIQSGGPFFSTAALLLFLLVGLQFQAADIKGKLWPLLWVVVITQFVPFFFTLELLALLGTEKNQAWNIAIVLMTTGTGVAVQTLLNRNRLHTASGKTLALISIIDDLPAAALLVMAISAAGAFTLKGAQGSLNILGGVVCGALITALAPAQKSKKLQALLTQVLKYFLPVYLIYVGYQLSPQALLTAHTWLVVLGIVVFASLTKWIAAYFTVGRFGPTIDKAVVAWGLVPRGIPGLAFATTFRQLGIFDEAVFTEVVLVVCLTTWIGIAGLEFSLRRLGQSAQTNANGLDDHRHPTQS